MFNVLSQTPILINIMQLVNEKFINVFLGVINEYMTHLIGIGFEQMLNIASKNHVTDILKNLITKQNYN